MGLRAVIKEHLISTALHALLIGMFLYAAQPRVVNVIPDYRPNQHEEIVPLEDYVDALTVNRSGKADDAQNQLQGAFANLSAFSVGRKYTLFTAKRHIIRCDVPLLGCFQIRSPPV